MDKRKFLELCRTGSVEDMRDAIDRGFDIEIEFTDVPDDQLPIMNAKDGDTVRYLLEAGATSSASGETPIANLMIWKVAKNEAALSALAAIFDADDSLNSDWDGRGEDGFGGDFAVHAAVRTNRPDIIATVIEAGGDLALASNEGDTPLGIAASNGSRDCIQLLLDSGAPVRADEYHLGYECDDDDYCSIIEPLAAAKDPEIARLIERAINEEALGQRLSVVGEQRLFTREVVDLLNQSNDEE